MAGVDVNALIVKLTPFRESDRVVWLMTRERGLTSALVRGARRSHKRFSNVFDLGNVAAIRLAMRRGGMPAVESAALREGYWQLAGGWATYGALCHVVEVTRRFAAEDHEDPALFDAAVEALSALAERGLRPLTLRAFEARVLDAAGLAPHLGVCGECGRRAPEGHDARYSVLRSGLVCSRCLPDNKLATLPGAARGWLESALTGPIAQSAEAVLAKTDIDALSALLPAQIEHHLGGPLKALRFARRLPKPAEVARIKSDEADRASPVPTSGESLSTN